MAKLDVYEQITNRIIAQLEKGSVPWLKPWTDERGEKTSFRGNLSPVNAKSNRQYNGLNILLLWLTSAERGYTSNKWLTANQANELGGHILAGQNKANGKGGTLVYFMTNYEKKVKNADGDTEDEKRWIARGYYVFNVEQTSLAEKFREKDQEPVVTVIKPKESTNKIREDLETWFAATKADIRHGGNRAFYTTGGDYIQMPNLKQFKDTDSYYATKLHELIHWTGNDKRNGRTFGKRFGDDTYALEELVAELGSAFLCADLNVTGELVAGEHADVGKDQSLQHTAYIGSWLRALQNNKKFIFAAAGNARKACDFLHAFSGKATESEEEEMDLAA